MMIRLRSAALGAAALAALAPWARAETYYFPPLPVTVRFAPDARSPFCASRELSARLAPDFAVIGGAEVAYPDLELRCEPYEGGRARFRLIDERGKTADEFKVKVSTERDAFDSTAFLVARRLATGRKTIRAALSAFQERARYGYGKGGTSAFEGGNWTSAAESLFKALESDLEPGYLYFGLYASHAKLGHAAQARWYLMVYCASEGENPVNLGARRLAYLREMPRSGSAPAPGDLSRFRNLRDQKQWGGAIWELKTLIAAAPWTVEAYDALADSYKALGWELLEDNWRRRAKLARKAANDDRLHRRLLDALQAP